MKIFGHDPLGVQHPHTIMGALFRLILQHKAIGLL